MYQRILAPIDVSVPDICEQIFQRALFHMKNSDCALTLLAVAPNTADENAIDEIRTQLMGFSEEHAAGHDERITLKVVKGLPSQQVLDIAEADNADMILMGSHRGGCSQLGRATLGSTAAKIASQAKCDVCIVKAS
jgi:universal stress protein F